MNKNHNEAINGMDAIRTFVQQFGPDDIYTEILIEELLMELLSPSYRNMPIQSRENNESKTE